MVQKVGSGLDLQNTQLYNAIVQNLASAPSAPNAGLFYYDTAKKGFFGYASTSGWRPFDAAQLTDQSIPNVALAQIDNSKLITNPLARANHTGQQPASTISDLASVVKAYTLDSFAAPAADVSLNNHKLTNVLTGTNANDAVNLSQMQAYVIAYVAGQTSIKVPVRAYADSNITLSGLQTVDGVSVVAGDRVAAGGQTTGTQNNIYIVASGAWGLAADSSQGSQWTEGTEFLVAEGSVYGGSIFRQTTAGAITIGTTALAFVQTAKINTYTADGTTLALTGKQFSVRFVTGGGLVLLAGGLAIDTSIVARKIAGTITGDGSTTSFTLTHNLNTTDMEVQFRDSSGNPWFTDWAPTGGGNVNQITITFTNPLTNGQTIRVMVVG